MGPLGVVLERGLRSCLGEQVPQDETDFVSEQLLVSGKRLVRVTLGPWVLLSRRSRKNSLRKFIHEPV